MLYLRSHAAQGGGRSGDDAAGRDIMGDNGSGTDDGMVADMDTFEDDGAAANPDVIANGDRLCDWRRAADAVQIGIHDNDIPGDHAVAANAHLLLGDDFGVAIEIGAPANENPPAFHDLQAHAGEEGAVFRVNLAAVIGDARAGAARHGDDDAACSELAAQPPAPQIG